MSSGADKALHGLFTLLFVYPQTRGPNGIPKRGGGCVGCGQSQEQMAISTPPRTVWDSMLGANCCDVLGKKKPLPFLYCPKGSRGGKEPKKNAKKGDFYSAHLRLPFILLQSAK